VTFSINDTVYVIPLRRNGIILSASGQDTYEVQIGSLRMRCNEKDLKRSAQKETRKKKRQPNAHTTPKEGTVSLDLHGLSVAEAVQQVEQAINDALLAHKEKLEIVHGKGTGKVQHGVHSLLDTLDVIKHYRIDESNAGVTWVYF